MWADHFSHKLIHYFTTESECKEGVKSSENVPSELLTPSYEASEGTSEVYVSLQELTPQQPL